MSARLVAGSKIVQWWEAVLLVLGGVAAGLINAVAGGGSILTVPLLVLAGVPGNDANGSNRVGILSSNAAAATAFRRLGVGGLSRARNILLPVVAGSLVGSYGISQLTDDTFERVFGIVMLPVVFLSIRPPKARVDASPWHPAVTLAAFFAIGLYGGAIQAGVGLILLAALSRSGFDLVTANNVKVVTNLALSGVALAVFVQEGKVQWPQALVLAAGLTAGAWLGAHASVRGGERFIRVVMVVAALLLAGQLLDVYGWIAARV